MRGRGRQLETGTAGAAHQGDAGAADTAATQCWSCTSASGERIRESCCRPGAAGLQMLQGVRGSCCKRLGDAVATIQVVPLADVYCSSRQVQKQPPGAEAAARCRSSRQVQKQPPGTGAAARCRSSRQVQKQPPGAEAAARYRSGRQPRVVRVMQQPCAARSSCSAPPGAAAVRRQEQLPCAARSSCRASLTAAVAAAAVRLPSAASGGGCTLLLQLDCHRRQLPPTLSVAAATVHVQLRIRDRVPGEAAARTLKRQRASHSKNASAAAVTHCCRRTTAKRTRARRC
ncbi:unnamed protein product [Closterium sp. Naga37s-1]|nr:unnamed protein product [Closterium sp. Naga37s-1]